MPAMQLLENEALPAQKLCFDHALVYAELFFPGTIENYQASLPKWQRDTSHLWSVAGRPSGAPLGDRLGLSASECFKSRDLVIDLGQPSPEPVALAAGQPTGDQLVDDACPEPP